MYTNINTPVGIQAIKQLYTMNKDHIIPTFPNDFFLTVLETVMNNNVFPFGDTHW
jgi:spore maturation protein SpmA